jgi:hypothetical protein
MTAIERMKAALAELPRDPIGMLPELEEAATALVEEAKRNAELAELANSLIWWVEIGREVIDDREAGLYQPPEFCCICQEPKPPHAEGCPMETIEPADSFTDIDRAKWTDPLDALAAAQSERELPDD